MNLTKLKQLELEHLAEARARRDYTEIAVTLRILDWLNTY